MTIQPIDHAFAQLPPLPERSGVTPDEFRSEILPQSQPVVMRGLVGDWPAVKAGAAGNAALVDYVRKFDRGAPVETIFGPADIEGKFFYSEDLRGFNFTRKAVPLRESLGRLLEQAGQANAGSIYIQSVVTSDYLPGYQEQNALPFFKGPVGPRIWIGNQLSVQTHFDTSENIACVVAGRRRFTLFPPEQLQNLYVGPFEFTLAGPPVSLVRPEQVDYAKYPRFREALAHARSAILEPGDALFIPYAWWHHVQSLESFNVLVNYWWNEARADAGSPFDCMLHNLVTIRDLPPHQRAFWRAMFEHYVFGDHGDPVAHLPEAARGALGPQTEAQKQKLRWNVLNGLARELGLEPPPPP